MRNTKKFPPMTGINACAVVIATLLIVTVAIAVKPAAADDVQDAQQLVDKARLTFESVIADKNMGDSLQALVKKAKGVLIYPQVLRGAFVFGISGGSGVMLARDERGQWAGPAYYTMGEASFGLQAGGQPWWSTSRAARSGTGVPPTL